MALALAQIVQRDPVDTASEPQSEPRLLHMSTETEGVPNWFNCLSVALSSPSLLLTGHGQTHRFHLI